MTATQNEQHTAVAVIEQQPTIGKLAPVQVGERGVQLRTMEDLFRFSSAVIRSRLAPKSLETPEAVMLAVQLGMEIGLTPMSALQNIAVINGRPSLYGDAALALVNASGMLADYRQELTGQGDERRCTVTLQRKDRPSAVATSFSVADAKRAKLWGKDGPWTTYPDRMLMFRARGFALRDMFPEVLKGIITSEEAADIPSGPVVEMPRRMSDTIRSAAEPSEADTQEIAAAQREAARAKYAALPDLPELPDPMDAEPMTVVRHSGRLWIAELDRSAWVPFAAPEL
jgi:hypothetical protein